MSYWFGKNVLLGVTGSIAAYKSAILVREFIKLGANVKVIQTANSKDFVTPVTLSTLSKNPVFTSFFQEENPDLWNNHVDLGLWSDCMVIAPATAKTISKMASGECDSFLLATYMSARCPVFFAPAMDVDMYKHVSNKSNIEKLTSYGNVLIPPDNGELASGLIGVGRMAEPKEIINFIEKKLFTVLPLYNKQVLITAGPTYESIDPVRFIGNNSSGKMGFALAREAVQQGAKVILVTGPTSQKIENSNITRIDVVSSDEMFIESKKYFSQSDVVIMSAAVSDYKVKTISTQKIKKGETNIHLELEPNIDILRTLSKEKKKDQFICGFALETQNGEENAYNKLISKNMDMIVLNSLKDKGTGFGFDTNKVSIIDKTKNIYRFKLKNKSKVAKDIIDFVLTQI